MSEYVNNPENIVSEEPNSGLGTDYTPGYAISVKPSKVLEGASVNYVMPTKNINGYRFLNIDVNSEIEIVGLYNKYKNVWELEKGDGVPFVFTQENAQTLIESVQVYLYFQNLEGSNVYWDEEAKDYVVVPHFVEQRRIEDNDYIDSAFSEDRLPPLEPATDSLYRDKTNGYLLRDPYDADSYYVNWDLADQEETWQVFYKYQGLWVRAYPNTDFAYTLENAQLLKDAVNKRMYPYTESVPQSWKSRKQSILEKFGPNHHQLVSGIFTNEKLEMSEERAMRSRPDSRLSADGETLTGWYDQYSPYASGRNRY